MDDSKSCDGCVMFKGKICSIITAGREKDCPCRACLIKVMCIHACKNYKSFQLKAHNSNIEEQIMYRCMS